MAQLPLPAPPFLPPILPMILLLASLAAPPPVAAATLGLQTLAAPVIAGTGQAFGDPLLGLDLLGDGAAASSAPAPGVGLSVVLPFADPLAGLGALFVTHADGADFLSGDLTAAGFVDGAAGADVIELLFENLSGSAAAAFGWGALLEMSGEFGEDPFGAGFAAFQAPLTVAFTIAPAKEVGIVPLPATAPLLLAGLGLIGGGALRRRARHRQAGRG